MAIRVFLEVEPEAQTDRERLPWMVRQFPAFPQQ